jgi:predicted MFS family arabinose efflux permease
VGVLGAVLAYFIADMFDWRIAYFIGGGLGLALLVLRFNVFESGIFRHVKQEAVARGNFFALFNSWKRFFKYLRCIMIGLPIWFVIGILITFSPEFGNAIGLQSPIQAGKAVMFSYIGLSLGDMSSGLLSQYLKSRRKTVAVFVCLTALAMVIYLLQRTQSVTVFYGLCLFLGFAIGYWALFVTVAAEQFGTNLRATVATTVPNFVRGSVNLFTPLFLAGVNQAGFLGSAAMVGGSTILLALLAVWKMDETFTRNLDFTEK